MPFVTHLRREMEQTNDVKHNENSSVNVSVVQVHNWTYLYLVKTSLAVRGHVYADPVVTLELFQTGTSRYLLFPRYVNPRKYLSIIISLQLHLQQINISSLLGCGPARTRQDQHTHTTLAYLYVWYWMGEDEVLWEDTDRPHTFMHQVSKFLKLLGYRVCHSFVFQKYNFIYSTLQLNIFTNISFNQARKSLCL